MASLSETHLPDKTVEHAKKSTMKDPKAKRVNDAYALTSEKSLDLVIITEWNYELIKFANVIEKHYKPIIKSLKRNRKSLRVSVARYWNISQKDQTADQMACVDVRDFASTDEDIEKMFESMKDSGREFENPKMLRSRHSFPGELKGLGNVLYKVSHLTFRRKAKKMCILLASSTHRIAKPGERSEDPHPLTNPDFDIVILTRLLASRGLSLYIIGCLPNNVKVKYSFKEPSPDSERRKTKEGKKKKKKEKKEKEKEKKEKQPEIDFATDFFEPKQLEDDSHYLEALAHVTGGRYVPIFSTSCLTKVLIHLIEEDNALEDLMGFINDEVTLEVSRQFGDANPFHLSQTLCQRSAPRRVKLLQLNKRSIPLTCELSERLSWASNFSEMQENFNSMKTSCCVHYPRPHPILRVFDVECLYEERLSLDCAMKMVRRLLSRLA